MNKITAIMICLIVVPLSACNGHGSYSDLESYIQKLDQEAAAKQSATKISMPKLPTPITYQKIGARTPFDEFETIARNTNVNSTSSPLGRYPLNLLQFVGVANDNQQLAAYIMTPDNKLYQVRIGDSLGDHNGRITEITADEVKISEGAGNKPGTERIVTMQLKEETANGTH